MDNPTGPVMADIGSGNIFADLDLPDADDLLLKAKLAVVLHRIIRERALTLSAAAHSVGTNPSKLSSILHGNLREWSVERLMRMLTALEQDIEITVRPHDGPGETGTITLTSAAT